jgi:hypothetical protein
MLDHSEGRSLKLKKVRGRVQHVTVTQLATDRRLVRISENFISLVYVSQQMTGLVDILVTKNTY